MNRYEIKAQVESNDEIQDVLTGHVRDSLQAIDVEVVSIVVTTKRDVPPAYVTNADTLHGRMREGARGSLSETAAVEFLISTGAAWDSNVIYDTPEHGIAVFAFGSRTYDPPAWMSHGEQAVWRLVHALSSGVIQQSFWRLDAGLKDAFLLALEGNRS